MATLSRTSARTFGIQLFLFEMLALFKSVCFAKQEIDGVAYINYAHKSGGLGT